MAAHTAAAPPPIGVDEAAIKESLGIEAAVLGAPQNPASERRSLTSYDIARLRRDLNFLQRVDSAAYTETRTMYSSWTVNEARITAFLSTWMWERLGWAHSVRQICSALSAAPSTARLRWPAVSGDRVDVLNRLRSFYVDRLQPSTGVAWAIFSRERVTAGHMARMSIQEGALLAGYRALLARAEAIPEVRRVLSKIIDRRERSLMFFTSEAVGRIQRSLGEALTAAAILAVSGDPLRPAGVRLPGEDAARASIFSDPRDNTAVHHAYRAITDHIPRLPVMDVRRHLRASGRS